MGNDYTYDVNGNMTKDLNKGITNISYNHLNLPTRVTIGGKNIDYTYDAVGVKLSKTVSGVARQYAGNYVYENGVLQFFNHPEGYVSPKNASNISQGFKYVYQYKDHLGNVRLSYTDNNNDGVITPSTEIIEESNYYPFGLKHKGYNNVVNSLGNSTAQKFRYNGKELNESLGLNLYEMDFRLYDPAIGRFNGIDPVTHFFSSPYNSFDNNPVVWSDPSGADATKLINDLWNKSGSGTTKWTNNNNGSFSDGNGTTVDCDDCGGIQLYETAKYNNSLPDYDESRANESINVGSYSLTPYYKNGEIVAYGATRANRLEYIIAAGSVGAFQENAFIFTTAANLFYINGYAPDENSIALSQGDISGLGGMWKDALSSPEYYLYVATALAGGAKVNVNKAAIESNFRRFVKKAPSNSKGSATMKPLGNSGNYLFEVTSSGKVPGSKAVYKKWVNNKGQTYKMEKTTYTPDGKIIHVKPKY
ncbi:RHS repeat domain-containing protein [Tenacibaculum maritimum]|uniref:RHS repeat domain-containing protein n=1 Tax=Tenacibaculum maritimum TaxID=107401 RepID=UPI0013300C22|nr:RHS repeat-associated core domain-containing protein [Tenacibaculum maritimum]